jgi:hypothetical protein
MLCTNSACCVPVCAHHFQQTGSPKSYTISAKFIRILCIVKVEMIDPGLQNFAVNGLAAMRYGTPGETEFDYLYRYPNPKS